MENRNENILRSLIIIILLLAIDFLLSKLFISGILLIFSVILLMPKIKDKINIKLKLSKRCINILAILISFLAIIVFFIEGMTSMMNYQGIWISESGEKIEFNNDGVTITFADNKIVNGNYNATRYLPSSYCTIKVKINSPGIYYNKVIVYRYTEKNGEPVLCYFKNQKCMIYYNIQE